MYLTFHQVLKETMKVHESNKFKIPHMKKGRLKKLGLLPLQVHCEATLVNEVMKNLLHGTFRHSSRIWFT
jgi:hypothetical protein